jgi:hypothetical protein
LSPPVPPPALPPPTPPPPSQPLVVSETWRIAVVLDPPDADLSQSEAIADVLAAELRSELSLPPSLLASATASLSLNVFVGLHFELTFAMFLPAQLAVPPYPWLRDALAGAAAPGASTRVIATVDSFTPEDGQGSHGNRRLLSHLRQRLPGRRLALPSAARGVFTAGLMVPMGASGFPDETNNLGSFEFVEDVEGQALLAEQVRGALFSGGRRFELALAAHAISAVGGNPNLGVTSLSSSPAACRAQAEMTLAVNVADAESTDDAGAAYRALSGAAAPMHAAVASLSPAQLTASLAAERIWGIEVADIRATSDRANAPPKPPPPPAPPPPPPSLPRAPPSSPQSWLPQLPPPPLPLAPRSSDSEQLSSSVVAGLATGVSSGALLICATAALLFSWWRRRARGALGALSAEQARLEALRSELETAVEQAVEFTSPRKSGSPRKGGAHEGQGTGRPTGRSGQLTPSDGHSDASVLTPRCCSPRAKVRVARPTNPPPTHPLTPLAGPPARCPCAPSHRALCTSVALPHPPCSPTRPPVRRR